MSYATYFIIRQILMALMLYLGLHMLFVKLGDSMRGSFYKQSLRIMGLAFLFVPISCFFYTKTNRLDLVPNVSTAINLIAFFSTFVLMILAFVVLLGVRLRRWCYYLSSGLIAGFVLPLYLVLKYGSAAKIDLTITASYTYFVVLIILLITAVLYRLKLAKKRLENYFSDDMSICVKWIQNSVYMLLGLGAVCIVAPFFMYIPRWLRFVFMVYGVLCYLHIHHGYHSMLLKLTELFVKGDSSVNNLAEVEHMRSSKGALSVEVERCIEEHISEWLGCKSFIQSGITINDVAKQSRTNRTYLSKYINTKYNCSFRAWITSLRIEESKNQLLDLPEMAVQEIAKAVGFASLESFTHIFTRAVGASPQRWRDENLK